MRFPLIKNGDVFLLRVLLSSINAWVSVLTAAFLNVGRRLLLYPLASLLFALIVLLVPQCLEYV